MALDYAKRHAVGEEGQVGAVLVKDGEIVASGASNDPRGIHAEQAVIKAAGNQTEDSTLYVTIQPSLYRTDEANKSDSEEIIEAGIKRVVVGSINEKYSLEESKKFFADRRVEFVLIEDKSLADKCLEFFVSTGADQTPKILSVLIGLFTLTN